MPNPFLIQAGVSLGSSLIGGLFGGGGGDRPEIPPWLMETLRNEIGRKNFTGFLPDKAAFDRSSQAMIDDILAQLPIGQEQFNADLASRGIFGSGEAPAALYRDVYAPIARSAATVGAQSQLGYAQAFQQGNIAAENLRLSYLDRAIGLATGEQNLAYQDYLNDQQGQQDFFGNLGSSFGDLGNAYLYNQYFGGSGGSNRGGSNLDYTPRAGGFQ